MSRHIIEDNLNGEMYRDILKNVPTLLKNLRLEVRQNMWFQHDGCPAHYSVEAREVLDHNFNGHWTARLPDYQILIRQISFCGTISKTMFTNKN